MQKYDPHLISPLWNGAGVINDIQTQTGCTLKCFAVMISYRYNYCPLQLHSQVAALVGEVIEEEQSQVTLHFTNPQMGWYTPEPLVQGNLLQKLLCFSIGSVNDLRSVLKRVVAYLAMTEWDPIFTIGLERNGAVGHCAVCLVTEGRILCGCAPSDFVGVFRLHVYVLPRDVKQTLEAYSVPKPLPLSLNGSFMARCKPWKDRENLWAAKGSS